MDILIHALIPKTRKGAIVLLSVFIAICIVLSAFVFISWSQDQKDLKEKGQPDFNKLSQDQLSDGLIVKGTIDMLFDTYAEEYETRFGKRTSDESDILYYMVPVYDQDQNGNINIRYLITYKADPEEFDTLNKIIEETWSDTAQPTLFPVENGQILKLPGDISGYLKEWMENPGFYENGSFIDWCVEYNIFGTSDTEVIRSKIAPYMLIKTETAGTNIQLVWIFGGIGIVLVIILLIVIFSDKAGNMPAKKKETNIYRNEWPE